MTREEFVKAAEKALSVEALTDLYVRAGMLKFDEPKSEDARLAGSYSIGAGLVFDPTIRPSLTISGLVTIRPDGSIEYGKDYTPDATAKAFWDAVGLERKQRV